VTRHVVHNRGAPQSPFSVRQTGLMETFRMVVSGTLLRSTRLLNN
jgi:hypothetical protein